MILNSIGRNIILITYDSLRADHCSCYGYERETTEELDKLAKNGVSFTNAHSVACRTLPSMTATHTGEPLARDGKMKPEEFAREHFQRHTSIAETLSNDGYSTAAFNPNAYASRHYGFDSGFDYFQDFFFDDTLYQKIFERHTSGSSLFTTLRNVRNLIRREEVFRTWDTYVDEIVEWVEDQREPFFVWTLSLDTHFPYLTPRKYRQWSSSPEMYYYNYVCNSLIEDLDADIDKKTIQKIIDIYDDSICFADKLIGELRDRLAEYNPVFIIHGDHGESFHEKGFYGHFYPSYYEENLHVPLVVSDGDMEETKIEDTTSLADVPEIIEEVAETGEVSYSGKDWIVASDFDNHRNRNLVSVRTDRYKYGIIMSDDHTEEELFDLLEDPNEENNKIDELDSLASELRSIAMQQINQEKEELAIRRAVSEVKT